jgi:hypothetical protein
MYRTWVFSAPDAESLARNLEIHINEFADEVVSVSYSVHTDHHVLVVYRAIETTSRERQEAAVSVAEHIIDEAQS